MKNLYLLLLLVTLTISCKKEKVENRKYTVVCTFSSSDMVANKAYILNNNGKPVELGNLAGKQSIEVEVSVGESIRLEMSTPERIMASAFEVFIFYKEKELGFSNTPIVVEGKNTVRLDKTFEKGDFK